MAGPPVIIYVSLPPWRQELIKVTLPGCYFASGLMVVAAPAPLTLGIYAGHFFFGKIREETYRRVGLILFLGLGMLYLLERRLKIPVLFPFHVDMTLRM